jgi:hypothetical protein
LFSLRHSSCLLFVASSHFVSFLQDCYRSTWSWLCKSDLCWYVPCHALFCFFFSFSFRAY